MNWPIAVCTWSLGNDFDKLNILRDQTQLNHLHLAVTPATAADGDKYLSTIEKQGWQITSTMVDFPQEDYSTLESIKVTGGIVPDEYWEDNCKRIFDAIDITAQLGVKYLSHHFGFLDMEETAAAKKLFERAGIVGDKATEKDVQFLMETGQESADELLEFLNQLNHPAFAVNFDPANMLLYDKGNPIGAVETLASYIKHVHIKDALRTKTPGTWGAEVIWGTGEVGVYDFLNTLKKINFNGALAIEREAGDDRLGDINKAISVLQAFKG
jgi:sugar phosphate isomerase/epimerase